MDGPTAVSRLEPMITLGAMIRGFAPQALRLQLKESEQLDSKALVALQDKSSLNRTEAVRSWLQSYGVFQGIEGANLPPLHQRLWNGLTLGTYTGT